jgi:hypothetical protein
MHSTKARKYLKVKPDKVNYLMVHLPESRKSNARKTFKPGKPFTHPQPNEPCRRKLQEGNTRLADKAN